MSKVADERWWRSPEERGGTLVPRDPNDAIRREFLPIGGPSHSRRSFLKAAGFGFAGATLAGCTRGKDVKAIPYLVAPEEIVPGKPYWIATTCGGCEAGCGVLAKCMDGRPIKLEGNPESPISRGGLCAAGQASVLGLYDSHRLDGAWQRARDGEGRVGRLAQVAWEDADAEIGRRLGAVREAGGRVRVLTRGAVGPSTAATIERFAGQFGDARHVSYDALSRSAIAEAHARTHGVRVLPWMRFEEARLIVAFDADFLGTWISPVEFARGWQVGRDPDREQMARHVQLEARVSLTGSRADERVRLAPSEIGDALCALGARVAELDGRESLVESRPLPPRLPSRIERLATELWRERGRSLVVCGSNDVEHQVVVNWINELAGSYGTTLDLATPSRQCTGDDEALLSLLAELDAGGVDVLVIDGANPAYDLPDAAAKIAKAGLVIRIGSHEDETAAVADWVLAAPHELESWDDAEPRAGVLQLTQPTVPPLRSARTLRATLARWMGDAREDRELVRAFWERSVFPEGNGTGSFDRWFTAALERGVVEATRTAPEPRPFRPDAVRTPGAAAAPPAGSLALLLYPAPGMLDGRHAHNPWLHELPDPVTKVTWDNYASLSPATARRLGLAQGGVVQLTREDGRKLELPAHVQPGQHDGVVAVALGYGRTGTDRFHDAGPEWLQAAATVERGAVVGRNAAPLASFAGGSLRHDRATVKLTKRRGRVQLACTQDHHSLSVPAHLAPASGAERDAVRTATFEDWKDGHGFAHGHGHPAEIWPKDHRYEGRRWAMAVDLSACTGCSACVISCQAENNVPVVGKDEVRRHREMSWLRIDRYYKGDGDGVETVCPVLATVHGSEGLNQQVYNRCVGTRYCANNCPYKVRRFNWFDYRREDRLQNMVLNPDVTIRSRGVMEKCSMCVQRIQAAKAEAKRNGRDVRDGEVETACQQSCPTRAITFGDTNDPGSRVSKALQSRRAYSVLSELNVKPVVHYLGVVRNKGEESHG